MGRDVVSCDLVEHTSTQHRRRGLSTCLAEVNKWHRLLRFVFLPNAKYQSAVQADYAQHIALHECDCWLRCSDG
jgi:hypothetical protein